MTPTDQHQRLWVFEGTWSGDETLYPAPWDEAGGTARGTLVYRKAVHGRFMVSDYVEEQDGRVVFEGHGVYGYDADRDVYTMFWFDPSGGGGPAAPLPGRWAGETLTFERTSPRARYVYRFDGPERVTFSVEHAPEGGELRPLLVGRYARVKASQAP